MAQVRYRRKDGCDGSYPAASGKGADAALSLQLGHSRLTARSDAGEAILLLGGDKTGDSRWYKKHVPMADRLFDEHLRKLED